ncbi:hypothetical protein ACOMHN_032790 [Nucella lapillus]
MVSSSSRLFADDTMCHNDIGSDKEQQLQTDLDNLADWEQRWKMEFHQQKCTVINMTLMGAMAEWLKHRTSDPKVTGSSPGAW